MTATAESIRTSAAGQPPRMRRRPAVAAIGVALIALGAIAAVALATAATSTTAVVAVAATVARGERINSDDLVSVNLTAGQELATIPAAEMDALVGQWAAWDIPKGSLVTPDSVTADPIPAPGQAVVGLALAIGQMPSVALQPGDTVIIVGTPRQQDDPVELPPLASTEATVVAITPPDTQDVTVLNVSVPKAAAAALAARAATGRIAVVLSSPAAG